MMSMLNIRSSFKADIESSVDLDAHGVQQLAEQLAAQLREDEAALHVGYTPSSLAVDMPRHGGRIDKMNKLAHEVAWAMWPPANDAEKVWSLIKYSKMVSGLSKAIRDKWKQEEEERLRAKRSAAHLDNHAFCTLKSRPISEHVLHPKPMPVRFAELSELQPFFQFLQSNTWPWERGTTARDAADADTQKVEYPRGIFYSDGRMDLCKQVVGPSLIHDLVNSIKDNSHVRHFLLGNNVISPAGARSISTFLAARPNIKTWYLAGNCIDADGIACIAQSLEQDTTVEALWLKRNPIGPAGAVHLSQLLRVNLSLQTLDLSNCGLLDEGVASLVEGLTANQGLQHLYLGANGVTAKGAASLGSYLQHCTQARKPGLASLYLSVNRIGNEGLACMAEGLRCNTGLQRLMLSSNQIEAEGVATLCAALAQHPTLQVLGLGMYTSTTDMGELPNRIGDEGAGLLAGLLRSNHNLLLLDVSNNGLTAGGWSVLATAALDSPSLLHMDLERLLIVANAPLQQQFLAHMESNIQARYGVTRAEFMQKYCKYVRHPESVRYIASLYRTRDFHSKQTRKNMKKLWDDGDNTLQLVSEQV